jgi:mannose-1-phosphate guanylyltransferase
MKAMVLAAGRGTRVRPITDTVPKPMIPVINRPVMAFLIDLLRQHGFDQIIVSTSYLAQEIENYFGDGEPFGVKIAYSFEGYHVDGEPVPDGLGSAGGLKKLQEFSEFFDDTFAVLCGDAIIDLDLTEAVRQHREKQAIASIVLQEVKPSETERYGIVQTDADARASCDSRKNRSPKKRSARRRTRASLSSSPRCSITCRAVRRLTLAVNFFHSSPRSRRRWTEDQEILMEFLKAEVSPS